MRTAILSMLLLMEAASATEPARRSPPFSIQRLNAPSLALSQYKGKVVALAFISTTCPHCQALTTELTTIAREYGMRGVQILECAFNDDAVQTLPGFLDQFKPPFPAGWSNRAAVMSYLQYTIIDPRPLYVPHLVLIDRAGVIRGDYPGESPFFADAGKNIRTELDKLLKRPAAPKAPTAPATPSRQ
jgi:thiol-disulfide isomerase/thioredoxin